MYDYSRLRGRIIEKCGSYSELSRKTGLSLHTLSYKMNQKIPFKQTDIELLCDVLDIPPKKIAEYFFYRQSSK